MEFTAWSITVGIYSVEHQLLVSEKLLTIVLSLIIVIFSIILNLTSTHKYFLCNSLRQKCSYSEFFWSVFCRIQTEYGEMRNIAFYSVWMREYTDQKISEYGHFSRLNCQLWSLTEEEHFSIFMPWDDLQFCVRWNQLLSEICIYLGSVQKYTWYPS